MTREDEEPSMGDTRDRAERLDIEACEENLDHYARSGDARSCRDIALALARELTSAREQADKLEDFAEWLVSKDWMLPALKEMTGGAETVLADAITRARKALGKEG